MAKLVNVQATPLQGIHMSSHSRRDIINGLAATAGTALTAQVAPAFAQQGPRPQKFTSGELLDNGHRFFGSISRGLAKIVEEATRRWGQPNAYVLGQEGSGAFVAGLRYGEGTMYTRNAGDQKLYWQGPSLGFDAGGDGDRTMMLVYNLPSVSSLYQRFVGIDGSAYLVAGLAMTALTSSGIVVVPIRSGIGARLGVNVGYIKFTQDSTWNPF